MQAIRRYATYLFPFGLGLALGAAAMRLRPQSSIELWGLAVFVILATVAFVEVSRGGEP